MDRDITWGEKYFFFTTFQIIKKNNTCSTVFNRYFAILAGFFEEKNIL